MTSSALLDEFDPNYPETFDNSHEIYAEMRERCPVAHSSAFGGFWALFKYDDIVRIQEDGRTFITSQQNTVPKIAFTGRRPPLHFDPPEHADFRKPLDPVFKKHYISQLRPILESFADDLLAPMIARGRGDYALEFALPFAARAFGELLGLPTEFMLRVREIGMEYQLNIQAMDNEAVRATSLRLYEIAQEIITSRADAPPGNPDRDIVAALLQAGERGKPLAPEMMVACVRQLLPAAQAAPQAVLGSIAVHLGRDRSLQDHLRDHRYLIPDAIEEFLRLYAPYRVFARTAVKDVEIGGRHVRAGEPIAMIFASANRDETIFEDADTFRLDRKPNKHIAFGRGAHRCPAASLARLELSVGVERLLNAPPFALSAEPTMGSWLEFGPIGVPIEFDVLK